MIEETRTPKTFETIFKHFQNEPLPNKINELPETRYQKLYLLKVYGDKRENPQHNLQVPEKAYIYFEKNQLTLLIEKEPDSLSEVYVFKNYEKEYLQVKHHLFKRLGIILSNNDITYKYVETELEELLNSKHPALRNFSKQKLGIRSSII